METVPTREQAPYPLQYTVAYPDRQLNRLTEDIPVEKEVKRGASASADERERAVGRELLEKNEAKYLLEIECARLAIELKVSIGTAEGLEGVAGWRTHTVSRFDEGAFRRAHP